MNVGTFDTWVATTPRTGVDTRRRWDDRLGRAVIMRVKGYRGVVYFRPTVGRPVDSCTCNDHVHNTIKGARECAERDARRRNREGITP